MTKLCECGCGEPTKPYARTSAKMGAVKGQPARFLKNHHLRKYHPLPNPSGLCMCGCGETTPIYTEQAARGLWTGAHRRYVRGHGPGGFRDLKGAASPRWTGDDCTYGAVHKWVITNKVKTETCEHCKGAFPPILVIHKGISTMRAATDWANVDHKYQRILEDYIELCRTCHSAYDKEHNLRGDKAA